MSRIFDCFTFFNELDLLETRLHEMDPVVDNFVLVEATKTFTGKPKKLHFAENRKRFSKFLHKIEHVVVDFPDDMSFMLSRKCYNEAWAREWYQREQILRGLHHAAADDLVIVSDVDEIIAAKVLKRAVKDRRRGDLTVFTMPLYAYFVNRRCPGSDWTLGPRMAERRHVVDGQRMRMTKLHASRGMAGTLPGAIHTRLWNWVNCGAPGRVVQVPDAGWHLSSIGTWQAFREKVAAYSHFERMEDSMYRSETEFLEQVNALTCEVDEAELPQFIREHTHLFERLPGRQPAPAQ